MAPPWPWCANPPAYAENSGEPANMVRGDLPDPDRLRGLHEVLEHIRSSCVSSEPSTRAYFVKSASETPDRSQKLKSLSHGPRSYPRCNSCVDLLLEVNSDQLELRKLLKKRGRLRYTVSVVPSSAILQREPAMPLTCSQDVYKSLSR
jgi:hypothetical protein